MVVVGDNEKETEGKVLEEGEGRRRRRKRRGVW
jgi:hypothetical protein